MYMNCRVSSGFNGRLPAANFKAMEPLDDGPNCVVYSRRKVVLFGILGCVGVVWLLMGFSEEIVGGDVEEKKTSEMCGKKGLVLQQHFNVSKDQLLALASLFSESDQIASLECTKERGPGMLLTDNISCALKAECSDEREYQEHHKGVGEYVEAEDQCPVQDNNLPMMLDLSLQETSLEKIPQFTLSTYRICQRVDLRIKTIQIPNYIYIA